MYFNIFNNTTFWAIVLVLCVIFLVCKWGFGLFEEEVQYELTEEGVKQLSEYRTYMVNQWLCLLTFWFNIKVEEAETKMVTPGIDQTGIYFFYENIEIYTLFDWQRLLMEVKTSIYEENGGYKKRIKHFSFKDGSFPTDRLYNFVLKSINMHASQNHLTPEDMKALLPQIKAMGEAATLSDEEAREHFFTYMAELIILMRKKRLLKNKKLVDTYMGLLFYLWSVYGEEFIQFLTQDEEETKGNE